ncbi:MAG: hypothetical protein ACREIC_04795, partial [Limisphaerales bacterium]
VNPATETPYFSRLQNCFSTTNGGSGIYIGAGCNGIFLDNTQSVLNTLHGLYVGNSYAHVIQGGQYSYNTQYGQYWDSAARDSTIWGPFTEGNLVQGLFVDSGASGLLGHFTDLTDGYTINSDDRIQLMNSGAWITNPNLTLRRLNFGSSSASSFYIEPAGGAGVDYLTGGTPALRFGNTGAGGANEFWFDVAGFTDTIFKIRGLWGIEWRGSRMMWEAGGTPGSGTWSQGDIIWEKLVSAGGQPGYVCTTSGTFSSATDNTGDTDGSTGVITGMTDTSDFSVGDYVSVSAGFASTGPFRITTKSASSITVDANSNSVQSNVTVDTPDPVFKAMAAVAA